MLFESNPHTMVDGKGALLDPFPLFWPAIIIDVVLKHCLRVSHAPRGSQVARVVSVSASV